MVETGKSFEQASLDLDSAVKRHGFGVLYVHDLGATLRSKGISFNEDEAHHKAMNEMRKLMSTEGTMEKWMEARREEFDALPECK